MKVVSDDVAYADGDKVILKQISNNSCIRNLGAWFHNGENIRKFPWKDRVLAYNRKLFDETQDMVLYKVAAMKERATLAMASQRRPSASR